MTNLPNYDHDLAPAEEARRDTTTRARFAFVRTRTGRRVHIVYIPLFGGLGCVTLCGYMPPGARPWRDATRGDWRDRGCGLCRRALERCGVREATAGAEMEE